MSAVAETVRNILNGDDLSFGIRYTQDGQRIVISSVEGEAVVPVAIARKLHGAMERTWGEKDIHCILLDGLIDTASAEPKP